tara:strand:+ start:161 stop:514 length:354 start_codon:yes stop_codon:yes gene_type:complete
MTNLTLNKIYDCRNIGQLEDGYPFTIKIECKDDKGAEYKGWYYIDDNWGDYKLSHGRTLGDYRDVGRYYFHQSKLQSGKTCCRKVSAKIEKMIINLIEANKSSVRNYSFDWERTKSA